MARSPERSNGKVLRGSQRRIYVDPVEPSPEEIRENNGYRVYSDEQIVPFDLWADMQPFPAEPIINNTPPQPKTPQSTHEPYHDYKLPDLKDLRFDPDDLL